MQNNNISNRSDFEHLKAVQRETDKKIAALKKTFEGCEEMYEVYKDIADTYYSISKGDYISELVDKEQHTNKNNRTKSL